MRMHPVVRSLALHRMSAYLPDHMDVYSGPMPATADVAPTGTLLARFGVNEALTETTALQWEDFPLTSITDFNAKSWIGLSNLPWASLPAVAAGVIGYVHIYNSSTPSVHVFASVGIAEGSGEVLLSSLSTTVGSRVSITKIAINLA